MAETDQPKNQRYITTHDPTTGQSVFEASISPSVPRVDLPTGFAVMQTHYASEGFPHQLSDNADLTTYQRHLAERSSGVVIDNGTAVRSIDFEPGGSSYAHRTLSVDCGVVVEGQIRLELDSGQSRLLQKGDIVVQRATMHTWHNPSATEVARMVFFIQPIEPLEVAGKTLAEEWIVTGKT